MTALSAAHGSFTIEREYPAPRERVFAAWTTVDAKREWFATQDGFVQETTEYTLDFRVGGIERFAARLVSGNTMLHETTYRDIVPNERIVATYDVLINDSRISVSLFSIQFIRTNVGTLLSRTEDGVFLDGFDTAEEREVGVRSDVEGVALYLAGRQEQT